MECAKLKEENIVRLRYAESVFTLRSDLVQDDDTPVLCVIIVGESATRRQLGIYGNTPDTTPFFTGLKQNYPDNFFIFPEAFAVNVYTKDVLPEIFSNSSHMHRLKFAEKISIFDLCRAADIYAGVLSNQNDSVGQWYYFHQQGDTVFTGKLTKQLTVLDFTTPPDEVLLPLIEDRLQRLDFNKKNLLIIHLFGSHVTYSNRVPNGFIFPIAKKQYLSDSEYHYARSIYYTDWILSQIFTMVERRSTVPYVILYLSDHGEDPTGKVYRSEGLSALSAEIFEIPCTVFLSDQYIDIYPDKYEALRQNFRNFFCNEFIFDSIIGLLNLRNLPQGVYHPEMDIFSNDYEASKNRARIVNDRYSLIDVLGK